VPSQLNPTSTLVIWNPGAGSTAAASEARKLLEQRPEYEVCETPSRDEALAAIHSAIKLGCRNVIAAGGDGTVNAVLQALADCDPDVLRETSLGILPLGTGNDLARTLQIPLDPLAALEVLSRKATIPGDIVRFHSGTENRVVSNMCTAGNTGQYLTTLTPDMKQRWGPFCYLRGVIQVLADLQAYTVRVQFDAAPWETVSLLNLFVANGQTTGAGLTVAPMARVDDGWLDVILIQDGDAGEIAALTVNYVMDDFLRHPLVMHRRVRSLAVESAAAFPVTIDGDVVTDQPFQITLDPQHVRLVYGDAPESTRKGSVTA